LKGPYQLGAGASYSPFFVWPVPEDGPSTDTYSGCGRGFDIYVFHRFHQKTLIRFTTELKYNWKRFNFSGRDAGHGGGSETSLEYTVGYIDLSFLPLFTIGSEKKLYLSPGICAGALVNTHAAGTIESWVMGGGDTIRYINGTRWDDFSKFVLRFCFRAEFEIPVSEKYQLLVINRYEFTCSEPHFCTISLGVGLGRIFEVKERK
jgi:hypothetical protein